MLPLESVVAVTMIEDVVLVVTMVVLPPVLPPELSSAGAADPLVLNLPPLPTGTFGFPTLASLEIPFQSSSVGPSSLPLPLACSFQINSPTSTHDGFITPTMPPGQSFPSLQKYQIGSESSTVIVNVVPFSPLSEGMLPEKNPPSAG
jgi:hypothetical protein